jgi:hypothetical protein
MGAFLNGFLIGLLISVFAFSKLSFIFFLIMKDPKNIFLYPTPDRPVTETDRRGKQDGQFVPFWRRNLAYVCNPAAPKIVCHQPTVINAFYPHYPHRVPLSPIKFVQYAFNLRFNIFAHRVVLAQVVSGIIGVRPRLATPSFGLVTGHS